MLTFLLWTMQNSDARARAAMQNFPGARARASCSSQSAAGDTTSFGLLKEPQKFQIQFLEFT